MADLTCVECNALLLAVKIKRSETPYPLCPCGGNLKYVDPIEMPVPSALIRALHKLGHESGIQVQIRAEHPRKITVINPDEPPPLDKFVYDLRPDENWWVAAHRCGLVPLSQPPPDAPHVEPDEVIGSVIGGKKPGHVALPPNHGQTVHQAINQASAATARVGVATKDAADQMQGLINMVGGGASPPSGARGWDPATWRKFYGQPFKGSVGGSPAWCCDECGFTAPGQDDAAEHSEMSGHFVYHFNGGEKDGGSIWPSDAGGVYVNPPGTKRGWE